MTKLERLREAIILALDPYFPNPQEQMPLVVDDVLAAVLVELREPSDEMLRVMADVDIDQDEVKISLGYRGAIIVCKALADSILNETRASKPLPEGQGPEMTQEQISAFQARWAPLVDVLKGDAP